jgi:hypothetical protein
MWALVRQTLAPSQSRSRAHGPASEAGMWTFSMACSGSFSRRRARADVFASPCRFRAHILARFAFACPFSFCVCVLARRCSPAVSRSFSRARVRFCAGVLARTCSPARVALVSVFVCPGSLLRGRSCGVALVSVFACPGPFAQAFLRRHARRPVLRSFSRARSHPFCASRARFRRKVHGSPSIGDAPTTSIFVCWPIRAQLCALTYSSRFALRQRHSIFFSQCHTGSHLHPQDAHSTSVRRTGQHVSGHW